MKKAHWLWILGAAAVAIGLVLRKKSGKPSEELPAGDQPMSGTFTKTNEENGVFTRPDGITAAPLLIVYGGVTSYSYATKAAMEAAMPATLKQRVFTFSVDYKSGEVSKYLDAVARLAAKYGLTFTDMKLMGYSGGASEVSRADWSKFSLIGLIDPYVTAASVNLPSLGKVKMIYRPLNWGGSAAMLAVRDALPKVAAAVKAAGGEATELSTRHKDMPTEFFKRYESVLAKPIAPLVA